MENVAGQVLQVLGLRPVELARMTVKDMLSALWRKACERDNIAPGSLFVAFSQENQAANLYSEVFGRAQQLR